MLLIARYLPGITQNAPALPQGAKEEKLHSHSKTFLANNARNIIYVFLANVPKKLRLG